MEIAIYVLLTLGALVLVLGAVLLFLSRKKPEALIPLLSWFRRFSWFRRKSDEAALRSIAENPETLKEVENLSGQEMKLLERTLSGRSESERLEKLQRIQELSEKGDLQAAARVLQEKSKTPDEIRAKKKAQDARRRKKKAARKQKKRSR